MEERCAACTARARGICGRLTEEALSGLAAMGRRKRIAAGETLIWQGEDSPPVANLLSGLVQLSIGMADGREQIVGLARPGDVVGRPFGRVARERVTALADTDLCLFPRPAFERTAREQPELEHDLLERALDDLDRARAHMLLLSRKTAGERVASFLLDLDPAPDGTGAVELPVSRQQIADILGLTIETVSRQLTRLKAEGAIALNGRRGLSIHSRPALEAAAGG